ncbi:hypothetical protein FE374_17455 [Georgenia yuyongxinii]|uniref:Hydantoinase B/oxoprolinase domain-containing protein n=1 Tax=Georgenia yuyongxinii TaxID=2589797 RepID=A0A5B8C618_9MICO|nr:hypothetical protein FE374_17455 [Georgenia yuyongxinii]
MTVRRTRSASGSSISSSVVSHGPIGPCVSNDLPRVKVGERLASQSLNCTLSGLRGGVFASVLPVIAPDIPWNSGIMRAISVEAPEGLVVNAKQPAPCGGATVGGAYMVKNTAHSVISALATADPSTRDEAMAESTGSIQVFHVGGLNQHGYPFGGAVTEALTGGGGATAHHDGIDYAGPHEILSYQITNVEGDESNFPRLWLRREINTDSGGAGRHHGGSSLSSAFTVHDANFVHGVLMAHSLSMPSSTGLHGGLPGATHHVRLARGTNVKKALASGAAPVGVGDLDGPVTDYAGSPGELFLTPGDVVDWSFHGGGGWCDGIDADAQSVGADVARARISVEGAERYYGVVVKDGEVDVAATTRKRDEIRARRIAWPRSRSGDVPAVATRAGARRIGDKLLLAEAAGGGLVFACDCGHVLAPGSENWKTFAGRATLTAEDLGARVRLHPELVADGYACPGCGSLLAVEVRWQRDEPLHDVQLQRLS